MLQNQTSALQNGIYIVESIGSTVILTRAFDQQSIEQLKAGQFVVVGAGSLNAGNICTLVEPLPQNIGVDDIVFNNPPTNGNLSNMLTNGNFFDKTSISSVGEFQAV